MIVEIAMPNVGQAPGGSKVIKWLKQIGDRVDQNEALVEVETDKSVFAVEAQAAGTLARILIAEGGEAGPLTPLGLLTTENEDVSQYVPGGPAPASAKPGVAQVAKVEAASPRQPAETDRAKASPVARALAREQGIDLGSIRGTGPSGRIVEADVRRAIAARAAAQAMPQPAPAPVATPLPGDVRRPLSAMRRAVGQRTRSSVSQAPHYYTSVRVDMTELSRLREMSGAAFEARLGVKPSYNDFILRAVAITLPDFPALNCSVDGDDVIQHAEVNLGLVVQLDEGIIIPVLHQADRKSLIELAREARALAQKARAQSLAAGDLTGGTFTVSNLGMYGVHWFTAIINPPEVAILAVGAVAEEAVVRGGQVVVRSMANLVLSSDHRVVDGVVAAQFLQAVQALLEAPHSLFLT